MVMRVVIVLLAAVVVVLMVAYYMRSTSAAKREERPADAARGVERFSSAGLPAATAQQAQQTQQELLPRAAPSATSPQSATANTAPPTAAASITKRVSFRDQPTVSSQGPAAPVPSEPGSNEDYIAVDYTSSLDRAAGDAAGGACFPQDRLTPDDLLPKDAANSKWAQVVPAGQGDVKDQNFLTAGFHVGMDTVGQTRKNPNLQLRSELPNPKVAVSPWMNSSYEPDQYRRGFELGES